MGLVVPAGVASPKFHETPSGPSSGSVELDVNVQAELTTQVVGAVKLATGGWFTATALTVTDLLTEPLATGEPLSVTVRPTVKVPAAVKVCDGVLPVLLAVIFFGRSESLLRSSSQWAIQSLEARYPVAGEWVNINTPPNSVVMANQHSGSLRWYGKRQTIRWDFIEPQRLAPTVSELQSRGATVYVALEGDEVAMFEQRFKDVIDQLQVDHVGSIRNVSFRRLLAPK